MRTICIITSVLGVLLLIGVSCTANSGYFIVFNSTRYTGTVFLSREDDKCYAGAQIKRQMFGDLLPNCLPGNTDCQPARSSHEGGACGVKGHLNITIVIDGKAYILKVNYSLPEVGPDNISCSNDGPLGIKAIPNSNINTYTKGLEKAITCYTFLVYDLAPEDICDAPIARVAIAARFADRTINGLLGNQRSDIHASNGQQQFGNGFFVDGDADACAYYGCKVGKAFGVWGDIWRKYHEGGIGAEHGRLGWPITDEQPTTNRTGGAFCHFQGGSIYWCQPKGSHAIWGLIRDKWAAMGWENSSLGFPRSDEKELPNNTGVYQQFEYGSIYFKFNTTEAFAVEEPFLSSWGKTGFEKGMLGFPTSEILATPTKPGYFQRYEEAVLYRKRTGYAYIIMYGPMMDAYASQKWEQGKLGFPLGNAYKEGDGTLAQKFEGGKIEDGHILYY